MAEDLGERTEDPTGRKLSEARSSGRVPKSMDLAAAVDLVGAAIILALFGGGLVQTFLVVMRRVLGESASDSLICLATIQPDLQFTFGRAAIALVPVMLVMAAVAYLSHAVQIGWLFTTKPLEPKLNRLNIVANAGQLFSKRNLVKTILNSFKMALVMLLAWSYISRNAGRLTVLPMLHVNAAMWSIGVMAVELAIWLLAALLVLGVADWLYQRWQFHQDMKMTKQEVTDERRSMDGDPKIKAKRFRMMQEIAMQRARQAVPQADVIVTNPTHFSVAIQYDQDTMRAPKVTAKGVDHMALQIRTIARTHQVPIVERPPLARAIYYGVEVGQEISPEHYQAVAEILAYVYRLDNQKAVAASVAA